MAAIAAGSAGSLVDPTGAPVPGAQKQRKKSKFRLKERSSSSVREKFINDPAYTEDVRHLALPMRRNSGPEHDPGRKFYMIPKKKSNSVGKDYSRGSGSLHIGGGGTGVSEDFYTLDVESIRRAGLNVPEVKPRRKKYNHHTSAELLNRLLNTDESSSSDGLPAKATTLDRARGRSLDRRSYVTTVASVDDAGATEQQQRGSRKNRNHTRRQTIERDVVPIPIEPIEDPLSHPEEAKAGDREASASKGGRFQIGKRFLKGEIGIKSFNYYLLKEGLKSSKKNLLKQRSAPVAPVADGQQSAALPEPPAAVMDAGSPPEHRVPDEVHRPVAKCEENIYEEIYFEDRPKAQGIYLKDVPQQDSTAVQQATGAERRETNDEKIQFIDCELCVQQCSNASCDLCHGRAAQHTAQQHEHHHHQLQQQRQAEQKQQNIYEQLKQHGSGGSSAGSGSGTGLTSRTKASKSLDMDELYQRQKQQLQAQQSRQKQPQQQRQGYVGSVEDLNGAASALYASRNVLQYQSYNPSNPNVYKLETTPVAFSSDYSPLQQIYYKPQPPQGALPGPLGGGQDPAAQHIYQKPLHQKPGNVSGSGSDYYQELAGSRKKSSSSSDSLHQRRLQRDQPLYHRSTTGVYQQRAPPLEEQLVVGAPPSTGVGAKLYKVSSNASILSEASGRSDGSYRQQLQQQQQQQHQLQGQQAHLTHPSIRAEAPPVGGQPAGQPYGRTGGNMSDSSLGDSLFSYPANRRYFGSSESCRFASESCRRCSVEVDKCSFSDTCRYSDCRNCDCSSSYFSSDFDDTTTHAGSRSKSGSRASHAPDPAAGYYAAPPYAEDFMKHVSAVKRGSQPPQQPVAAGTHLMAGGKIYETPPTYVGMMSSAATGLLKAREPTYETLRNPPYSIPMVGVPSGDALGLGSLSAARQSFSQSHEALLSPTRRSRSSRSTDTEQYPYAERRSPSPHYSKIRRPHQSSTLPSSVRSGRRQQYSDAGGYSVIREAPRPMGAGSTLPKSFSMQQPHPAQPTVPLSVGGRSSSLLAMGHEYAEISKDARKPIPPPISTIPTHRDGRTGGSMSRGKPKPAARSVSPANYGRTGRVEVEVPNMAEVTATAERKSRERTMKLKAGDQAGDTPIQRDRSPVAPNAVATGQEKGTRVRKEPTTGSGTLPGRATTGSTRRREFGKSREQQQHQRGKRRVAQDFSDDEEEDDDDEVFLSDKVYERPGVSSRGPTGTQAFDFTLQPPTSSSSSSGTQPHSSTSGGPSVAPHSPTRKSKQKPESDAAPATGTASGPSVGSATQPNESESLRTTTDHAGSKAPADGAGVTVRY
ncbi:uncharacterized protein LOC128267012 [Anopheles cruzii]|uniref:uncharacterized protein LOC128267012 n=1 Tax=Anopheles cruzii TaxID=68878 RepID=UPI0022EC9523|nr:uncharacterized protein LOC128267012 [Anopheles cruzii]